MNQGGLWISEYLYFPGSGFNLNIHIMKIYVQWYRLSYQRTRRTEKRDEFSISNICWSFAGGRGDDNRINCKCDMADVHRFPCTTPRFPCLKSIETGRCKIVLQCPRSGMGCSGWIFPTSLRESRCEGWVTLPREKVTHSMTSGKNTLLGNT